MLPLNYLLPLRAFTVTLRFSRDTQFRLFHQPILTAWLRHLLSNQADYNQYLTIDALESGHTHYQVNDLYRFTVIALKGGEALLQQLITQLHALPGSVSHHDPEMPLCDNVSLDSITDLWQNHPITDFQQLTAYDEHHLQQEIAFWQTQVQCCLRWLSPVALLRDQPDRRPKTGDARFCRHKTELSFDLLRDRLRDTLASLLRQRVTGIMPRYHNHSDTAYQQQAFWVDYRYYDSQGTAKPMGGLLGEMQFETADWSAEQWSGWVLGQYIGIGQRRVFGWGRYQLETEDGRCTLPRELPAASLLQRAFALDNVYLAYEHLLQGQLADTPTRLELATFAEQLMAGQYETPTLQTHCLRENNDKVRTLFVAPLLDRVLQRAAAQVITPALDSVMGDDSIGFRRGRSRQLAVEKLQQAYENGYCWVFESDVDDFFDTLSWDAIYCRLRALLGNDPVLYCIMQWLCAPVLQAGEVLERQAGLPQGSPLSPVIANIMLDDFDRDLEAAGLRCVRFVDDFVVLCRSEEEAMAAAETVVSSLAEVGLRLNEEKTAVRSFAQGFRFVGYLFVNSLVLDVGGSEAVLPLPMSLPAALTLPPKTAGAALFLGEMRETGTAIFVTGRLPCIVSVDQGRLQVRRTLDNGLIETVVDKPWPEVEMIVLLGGQHHITTPALRAAYAQEVVVHFVDSVGEYQGSTQTAVSGMAVAGVWLAQVAWLGVTAHQLQAAKQIVIARLRHSREVLRNRNKHKQFDDVLEQLMRLSRRVHAVSDLDSVRGLEGKGTQLYFAALKTLLPKWARFKSRQRRPPPDPFNALLSLGYTVLFNWVEVSLRVNGLLPWVGVYHQPHGQHPVLASDLMESFRHVVERVALNAVNKRVLSAADFVVTADQGCRLQDEARRQYIALLVEQFETPIRALHSSQPMTLHGHLHWQAVQVRKWVRGEVKDIQIWRVI